MSFTAKSPKYLGKKGVEFSGLDTFPNREEKNLTVTLHCSEFTCRCPSTNQPDFATIDIVYQPNKLIVESKSVKMYLETFRERGIFHEHLAQLILDDFIDVLHPTSCKVTVHFNTRGGIAIDAVAESPGFYLLSDPSPTINWVPAMTQLTIEFPEEKEK